MSEKGKTGFDSWVLVELMGHQRIAGKATEEEIGGSSFLRVDVPEHEGRQALTKFLGPSSIYAITPVSEQTARSLAVAIGAAPISIWDAQRMVEMKAGTAKPAAQLEAGDDDDDEEDNDFH